MSNREKVLKFLHENPNLSYVEIANMIGVSRARVQQIAAESGYKITQTRQTLDENTYPQEALDKSSVE